jgi:RNA recognition motif-containing protein
LVNIYVGNMSFSTGEEELRQEFSQYGEVSSVRIITDRQTGQPRGFGFVEMPDDDAANKAIEELNGKELGGRALVVNKARPKRQGFGGGGRGGGRGGGGGGGRERRDRW